MFAPIIPPHNEPAPVAIHSTCERFVDMGDHSFKCFTEKAYLEYVAEKKKKDEEMFSRHLEETKKEREQGEEIAKYFLYWSLSFAFLFIAVAYLFRFDL